MHEEMAQAVVSAVIQSLVDFGSRKRELKRELRRIARNERRAAMKQQMEERGISIWSIIKVVLMLIGAAAVVAGVIYAVNRFLDARDDYLYGGYEDEEDDGIEDPDIAGEFEAAE